MALKSNLFFNKKCYLSFLLAFFINRKKILVENWSKSVFLCLCVLFDQFSRVTTANQPLSNSLVDASLYLIFNGKLVKSSRSTKLTENGWLER